jgi:hypothetical protein
MTKVKIQDNKINIKVIEEKIVNIIKEEKINVTPKQQEILVNLGKVLYFTQWGKITGDILNQQDLIDYIAEQGGDEAIWGNISGNLENQTDLSEALSTIIENLSTHIDDKGNPHEVTAGQVGAVSTLGDTITGDLKMLVDKTVTRDGNGAIASWTIGDRTYTATRVNGLIVSYTDGDNTWTINRDINNYILGVTTS